MWIVVDYRLMTARGVRLWLRLTRMLATSPAMIRPGSIKSKGRSWQGDVPASV